MIEKVPQRPADTALEDGELDFAGIRACVGPGLGLETAKLRTHEGRIRATGRGRFVLNEIVRQLSESFAAKV